MSLWICRPESVKRPYYVEVLGIHLYSSQELSYVIYNYPLLVMEDFVDEALLMFLRDELNQGFLALKIQRWLKSNENPDDVLLMILQEGDYYTASDINSYRQQMQSFRKLHPAEFKKAKADSLFAIRQYGRAKEIYQEILEMPANAVVNEEFYGRIWNNIGVCEARMFQTQKAFHSFEKAYEKTGDMQVLEQMYQLSKLDQTLSMEAYEAVAAAEQTVQWDENLKQAKERAVHSEQVQQLDELFAKDPIKRQAGMAELVTKWKKEYRSMV